LNLAIQTYTLGMMDNNAYVLFDTGSRDAVLVDPPFGSEPLAEAIIAGALNLKEIWITHAHFDHIAGVNTVLTKLDPSIPIRLHPADLPLWMARGGADHFGLFMAPLPLPTLEFSHRQVLSVGVHAVEVRHAPGHTPGHVMFYCAENSALICGDVIFQGSIGRTDLEGGDSEAMVHSLQEQVLSLPIDTCLLPGHGPQSTIQEETRSNPYLTILNEL
jgi:hydroxyacylglutathione hydrolase